MKLSENQAYAGAWAIIICALLLLITAVVAVPMYALPQYRIYSMEMRGKAQLKESEWNKQIIIEEARAKKEAAKLEAESEEIRAHGVAKANEIIGDSLQGKEEYLRYLWINGLQDEHSEVIYVPTEAGLPILEAGKRND